MKAKEIAKYLEHAPDDMDYRVITEEQYNALVIIAYKYSKVYNELLTLDTHTELATIQTMIMNPDACLTDI